MSVYTYRFLEGNLTAGQVATYTVPAGTKSILRDVEIYAAGGASASAVFELTLPGVGSIGVVGTGVLASQASRQWTGTIALDPGDQLLIVNTSGVIHCVASGYNFQL